MAHTHSMQDTCTYAWLFADYTWKHTYTPAVAAFLAKEQITAEAATAEAATTTGISQCQVPPVTSAGAVLSASAATAAAIPMAGAVAHPSTLIKTSKLPLGDSR